MKNGDLIYVKLIDIHRDKGKQISVTAPSNRRNASVLLLGSRVRIPLSPYLFVSCVGCVVCR